MVLLGGGAVTLGNGSCDDLFRELDDTLDRFHVDDRETNFGVRKKSDRVTERPLRGLNSDRETDGSDQSEDGGEESSAVHLLVHGGFSFFFRFRPDLTSISQPTWENTDTKKDRECYLHVIMVDYKSQEEKQMKKLTYPQVQNSYPEAWNALPEPYKNDSCLKFFLDVNDNLCADCELGLNVEECVWDGSEWVKLQFET